MLGDLLGDRLADRDDAAVRHFGNGEAGMRAPDIDRDDFHSGS